MKICVQVPFHHNHADSKSMEMLELESMSSVQQPEIEKDQ